MAAPEKPTSRDLYYQNSMTGLSSIYAIKSSISPNVYLRMDGSDITVYQDSGSGQVNCQFGQGLWERFILWPDPTEQNVFTIGSLQFPGVYLRMDGSGPTNNYGEAVVNCQFTAGAYERFVISPAPNQGNPSLVTIGSVQFPNLYLRMMGSDVTSYQDSGGGVVGGLSLPPDWDAEFYFYLCPL